LLNSNLDLPEPVEMKALMMAMVMKKALLIWAELEEIH
jgi:hypothetical protein